MVNKESFLKGVRETSPVILGIIPFGLISGITAADSGLSLGMALFMSIGIFAGAAQLAALQLISNYAHMLVVIYTALIVNMRMMMYSLSISPHLQHLSNRWKAFLAYGLTDQNFAISTVHFMNEPKEDKKSFLLGSSFTLWTVWQLNTVIGYALGSTIPAELGLDFGITLTFMSVLFKAVADWPGVVAVFTSAVVAVATASFPMNTGLVIAAVAGIFAGVISENFFKCKEEVTDHE